MASSLSVLWALQIPPNPRSANVSGNRVQPRLSSKFSRKVFCVLDAAKLRRSASYHPTVWENTHILSFSTPYSYKSHEGRLEELKQLARASLETANREDPQTVLRIVDSMQRLGIAYHFEDEIKESISYINQQSGSDDLYTTALKFRILREHGVSASSDLFDRFRGPNEKFSEALGDDIKGVLSLYEASHLGLPGEDVMDETRDFAMRKLEHFSSDPQFMGSYLAKHVKRSLEIPLYLRPQRVEARDFIEIYELDEAKDSTLLELAKLDYNLVQSLYQDELKYLASWWRDLGFKENLEFARDRLVENYLWATGIIPEHRFSKCRVGLTKFISIISTIDDMYDIYGSLDELEYFTNAVSRWDLESMTNLPLYMKICYIAVVNFGNELIYDVLNSHGLDVSVYLKQEWLNVCKSYLVEAKWFSSGYRPSFEEYMGNAVPSVGGRAAIVNASVLQLLGCSVPKTSLELCFNNGSELIHWSSFVMRLADDLGTAKDEKKRGDVAKAAECYAKEKKVTDEEAEIRIKEIMRQSWKIMNQEMMKINGEFGLPNPMVKMCLNMARTAQFIFQHGDAIGTSNGVTRDLLTSLIVKPVPYLDTN